MRVGEKVLTAIPKAPAAKVANRMAFAEVIRLAPLRSVTVYSYVDIEEVY
ncbi:MAG: hypothetical protein WA941_13675 [Nitrososphaeraceae archaeon]